jgi:DNA-binding beta-propeller fold protein YncE
VVKTINAYDDYIVSGGHSADGKRFYACGWESIYAIDTKTNELIDTYNFSSPLSKVAVGGFGVSNDGEKLYLAASIVKKKQNVPRLNVLPPQLVVYDMKKKSIVKNYEIPYGVLGVFPVRKDPNSVVLLGLDVFKLNLKNGKLEKLLGCLHPEEGEQPKNMNTASTNTSPGDHGLVAAPYYIMTEAGPTMGYVIIDTNNGTVKTVAAEHPWFEYSVRVSPDKKYLYAAMDELIKVDIKTGKTLAYVTLEKGTVYCVAVSSDGKKVYVGPGGPDISVYDADTLELLGVIPLDADGKVSHLIPR